MYAILKHGGHQYRVTSGDRILVERLPADVGSSVTLENVLLLVDGDNAQVSTGAGVEGSVTATVVAHRRGRKIRVFTYKPKKRTRRTLGYRSQLTELRIDEVRSGASAPAPAHRPKRASKPAVAEPADAPEEAAAEAEAVEAAAPAVDVPAADVPEAETPPAPKRRPARAPRAKPAKEKGDGA